MRAILINEKNHEKITQSNTASPDDISVMMEYPNMFRYFVPEVPSEDHDGMTWATYPQHVFDMLFDYDAEKIKTDFVEITFKE